MAITGFWAGLNPLQHRPGDPHEAPKRRHGVTWGRPPKAGAACVARPAPPANRVGRPAANAPKILPPPDPWGLTTRQAQILDMLVQGMGTAQIADKLNRSISTISHYTTVICKKMAVSTIGQAVYAWHKHYRVLLPDAASVDRDSVLIQNLQRAIDAARAAKDSS